MSTGISAKQTILVVAPHPDDDLITSAGIIHGAVLRGDDVVVVYMTNGDIAGKAHGLERQDEAVSGQARLGVAEQKLIFLGYPDAALREIHDNYQDPNSVYTYFNGYSTTYGARGLGGTDYHSHVFGTPANYNAPNIVADLKHVLDTYRPDQIFTTAFEDTHPDHKLTYVFLNEALDALEPEAPGYYPTMHKTLVHVEGETDSGWAEPDPEALTPEPPNMHLLQALHWADRASINVDEHLQDAAFLQNLKAKAIVSHASQGGEDPNGYLQSFVHKDEFFWVEETRGSNTPPHVEAGQDLTVVPGATVTLDAGRSFDPEGAGLQYAWVQASGPAVTLNNAGSARPTFVAPEVGAEEVLRFELRVSDGQYVSAADSLLVTTLPSGGGTNIASLAEVTASSESPSTHQLAVKTIDGIADGWPGDYTKEWATAGGGVGAWIELSWDSPMVIDGITLFDRPNPDDQITSATLTFGDGTDIEIGALVNDGAATIFGFSPITTDSLRLTIDGVSASTGNVGLSEFVVSGKEAPVVTPNIAGLATATASSETPATQQLASKAIDGVIDGWPGDYTNEWASFNGGAGEWLQLTWDQDMLIEDVTLFDRPNLDDHITSATLHFSDGTTIPVSGFDNDGTATEVADFAPIRASSLKVTIDSVSPYTSSAGLAEIIVRGEAAPLLLTVAAANVAGEATVSASSENASTYQLASKAVDGMADGWPGNYTHEWATVGGGAGSWIDLAWDETMVVEKAILHDRPNADDQVLAASLVFEDGTRIATGELANDGAPTPVSFEPIATTSLRVEIDAVSGSTGNVGLSELVVLATPYSDSSIPEIG